MMCYKFNMILLVWNTVVLLVLLGVYWCNGQIPQDQFFPFGSSSGDTKLKSDEFDSHSDLITLQSPFTFFNTTHSALYVNGFGNILFTTQGFGFFPRKCDSNKMGSYGPVIAPFWSLVHLKNGGQVLYRETSEPSLTSKAHAEVKKGFPDVGRDLSFTSVFIATWDRVAHFRYPSCLDDNLRNTFQAVLASDEKKSFVILYYNELTWTHYTRTVGSRCVYSDENPAAAGFTAGEGHSFQDVLGNCESDVLKLTEKSNVDELGKWVFRVDEEIKSPTFRLNHGYQIPTSDSPIVEQKPVSSVVNQTDSNEIVHSGSRAKIISSFKFYYYTILIIMCKCLNS